MEAELFLNLVVTRSSPFHPSSPPLLILLVMTLAPGIDKHTLDVGLVLVIRISQLVTRTLPAPARGDRFQIVLFGLGEWSVLRKKMHHAAIVRRTDYHS